MGSRFLLTAFGWASLLLSLFSHPSCFVLGQEDYGQAEDDESSSLETVQCRLDLSRTLNIQYSTFLEAYVELNPFIQGPLSAVLEDDDGYTQQYPVFEARVCWCSQYFNRRFSFCPAQFDSCKVEGADGPITCFTDYQGITFVRGFWFICIFWFAALLYAFVFSDGGQSARAFVWRKLCLRCSSSDTEEEHLFSEVETMIHRDPDRATWLLRSAFMRERSRQRREVRRSRRRGRGAGASSNNNNAITGDNNETEDTNQETSNSLSAQVWQQIMELKVKIYDGDGAVDDDSAAEGDHGDGDAISKEEVNDETPSSIFSLAANASQRITSVFSVATDNQHQQTIHPSSSTNNDDIAEVTRCAICLSRIQRGDRIGDIPCGHIFCVDCLKDWIKRKNHCPLCQRDGLATPRRSPPEGQTTDLEEDCEHDDDDDNSSLSATEEGRASPTLALESPSGTAAQGPSPDGRNRRNRRDRTTSRGSNSNSGRALRVSLPDHPTGSQPFHS